MTAQHSPASSSAAAASGGESAAARRASGASDQALAGQGPASGRREEATGAWVDLPTTVDLANRTLTAATDHFSRYGVQADPNVASAALIQRFQTSIQSGAAEASIPIEVPTGPGGIKPSISLNYSSARVDEMKSSGSMGSWVGLGWSLHLGSIRKDKISDRYFIEMDGISDEIVEASDGSGWYTRTERFARIEEVFGGGNNFWRVTTRDGTTYIFGEENGDVGDAHQTYWYDDGGTCQRSSWRWDLSKVTDLNGNTIEISYVQDKRRDWSDCWEANGLSVAAAYPSLLTYGAPGNPGFRIRFVSSYDVADGENSDLGNHRTDAPPAENGPLVWETRHLDDLSVETTSGQQIRHYHFSYSISPGGGSTAGRMRLLDLQQFGYTDAESFPKIEFTYSPIAQGDPNTLKIHWHSTASGTDKEYERTYLLTVKNGYGGTITFDYMTYHFQLADGSHTPPWPEDNFAWSRNVVETYTVDDGMGGVNSVATWTYHFPNPAAWPGGGPTCTHGAYYGLESNNSDEDEFRGFYQVIVDQPDGTSEIHRYHTTGGSQRGTCGETFNQWMEENSYAGREYETEFRSGLNGTGTLLRKLTSTWAGGDPNDPNDRRINWTINPADGQSYSGYTFFPHLTDVIENRNGILIETEYTYDSYGNVATVRERGDTTLGNDQRTTCTEYYDFTNKYVKSLPKLVKLYGNSVDCATTGDTPVTQTRYAYDGSAWPNSSTSLTTGRLTRLERGPLGSSWVTTRYAYDGFGNRAKVIDPENHLTETDYDPVYHAFVVATRQHTRPGDPPGPGNVVLETTISYSPDPARPTSRTTTDPNGQATREEYDGLGRRTAFIAPTETSANPTIRYTYVAPSGTAPTQISIAAREDSADPAALYTVRAFYDGLGRLVQEYGDDGDDASVSGVNVTNYYYDKRGRTIREAMAHPRPFTTSFDSADWTATASGTTTPYQTWSFDGLGRVTSQFNPTTGTSTSTYSGLTRTVIDARNHKKEYLSDGLGRLRLLREYTGNSSPTYAINSTTQYSYNALDNLTGVVQSYGSTILQWSMHYNALGWKTQMIDPDLGTWTYPQYDKNGNLLQQRDARGVTITMTYDGLNRLLGKDYSDSTPDLTYTYDEPTVSNGKGRRTRMQDGSGQTVYHYDSKGNLVREDKTIAGATYTTQWVYDPLNRVVQTIYPDSTHEQVTNTYNAQALLRQVAGSQSYASDLQHNSLGQLTFLRFGAPGSPVTQSWTYPSNSTRLSRLLVTTGPTTEALDLSYGYDPIGNITSISDSPTSPGVGENLTFTYDDLDRLTSATVTNGPAAFSETYSYDPIGNLTRRTDNFGSYYYTYDATKKHAVTNLAAGTGGSAPTLGMSTAFNLPTDAATSNTGSTLYAPWVARGAAGWTSQIVVRNASSAPVTLTITYYDTNGVLRATETRSNLPANGNVVLDQSQTLDESTGAALPAGFVGSARIVSTGTITAGVQLSSARYGQVSYTAVKKRTSGVGTLYAPYVHRNLTFGQWTSAFNVLNLSANPATITINIYPQGGGTTASCTLSRSNVPSLASYTVDLASTCTNLTEFTGTAVITASGTAPDIRAFVADIPRVNDSTGGREASGYLAVTSPGKPVSLPWVDRKADAVQWVSWLAIMNTGTTAASSTAITFYNPNGTVKASHSVGSIARNAMALVQLDQVPGLTDGWRGTAVVTSSCAACLAVVVNEQSLTNGYRLTSYDGDPAQASEGSNRAYLSLVLRNWGAGYLGSSLVAMNTGSSAVSFTIDYYDQAGARIFSVTTESVPPNGQTVLATNGIRGDGSHEADKVLTDLPFLGSAVVTTTPGSGRAVYLEHLYAYPQDLVLDASGNTIQRYRQGARPGQTLAYDAEQRLIQADILGIPFDNGGVPSGQVGLTVTNTYDGDGNRVRQRVVRTILASGQQTVLRDTVYVGELYEREIGGPEASRERLYYFAEGKRVGLRQRRASPPQNELSWLAGDHLGSTRLAISAPTSQVVSQQWYTPFGLTRRGVLTTAGSPQAPLATEVQFTGQRLDRHASLYHFGARMYDPLLGRFIQADTLVPGPGNPQAFNRYAYALNNPLRYADPSGQVPIVPIIIGGAIVTMKVLDYAWTAWDAAQSAQVLADPAAPAEQKAAAAANLAATAALELAEPDDLLPIAIPLDDLARVGMVKGTPLHVPLPGMSGGPARPGSRFLPRLDRVVNGQKVRRITTPLTKAQKNALYKETRAVYAVANPGRLTPGLEVHHRIPLEWAHLFPDADPNRLSNLAAVPKAVHTEITSRWNSWNASLGHPPTAADVMAFAAQIDQTFPAYFR